MKINTDRWNRIRHTTFATLSDYVVRFRRTEHAVRQQTYAPAAEPE